MHRALLVVGTDTGVGKTTLSLLLVAALGRRGLAVAVHKPVETGCQPEAEDALRLLAVAGRPASLDEACPYRLALPVAPESAAAAEGLAIDLARIRSSVASAAEGADLLLVESAGGLGTPYGPRLLVLDLARELDLPVLLVARHALGAVGQVLVALRLLRHERVPCLGVVLSQTTAAGPGAAGLTHAPLLRAHAPEVPLLGVLPHLGSIPPAIDETAAWVAARVALFEEQTELGALLAALGLDRSGIPSASKV